MKKQTYYSIFFIAAFLITLISTTTSCTNDDSSGDKMLPSEISSENSTTKYEYNSNSQLLKITEIKDNVSEITTFKYASNGLLAQISKSNTLNDSIHISSFRYEGDTIFVQTKPSFIKNIDTLIVDQKGRLLSEVRTINQTRNVTNYAYNSAGSMTQQFFINSEEAKTKNQSNNGGEKYISSTTFNYDGLKGIMSGVNIPYWQMIYLEFGYGYIGNYTQSISEYTISQKNQLIKSGSETKIGSYFYNLYDYPIKMVWKVIENDLVKEEQTFNISYIKRF